MTQVATESFVSTLINAFVQACEEEQQSYQPRLAEVITLERARIEKKIETTLAPEIRARFDFEPDARCAIWRESNGWNSAILSNAFWLLVPRDLPIEAQGLALSCWIDAQDRLICALVQRSNPKQLRSNSVVIQGDVRTQLTTMGKILLPRIKEAIQKRRDEEAQAALWERYRREQEERRQMQNENNRLHEAALQYARHVLTTKVEELNLSLSRRRAEFLNKYGWPSGRAITVYRIEWVAGFDEGELQREVFYATSPQPDESGWFSVFREGQLRPLLLVAPNGYQVHEEAWRSIEDIPDDLGLVGCIRNRSVYEVSAEIDYIDAEGEHRSVIQTDWAKLETVCYPRGVLCELLDLPVVTENEVDDLERREYIELVKSQRELVSGHA